ncbi:nuclear transcription factor Y subunit beta [Drosophila obscura]|uniref:nuclear transcription factor Y subunit beta n=1 Tax=Drosophila obscura TaxID=7282 RepID=UPI001BB1FB52|nr:nuclear transcription factor Y subunit beta [Drosophila obscura]
MMPRPGQTRNSSSSSSRGIRWHLSASLLLMMMMMMINALCVTSQYASPYGGSSQAYGYNLPQQQIQQQQQQQENAYASPQQLNYAQQYPSVAAEVQSLWTGAPIVVNDNLYSANNNLGQEQQEQQQQQQQQQRYVPINGYYREDYPGRQSTPFSDWRYNNPERQRKELEVPPLPTRAANHNYNNVPGYVYYQQQAPTVQPRIQPTAQPRVLPEYRPQLGPELDSSEARREEEQVIHIGGSRSLARNNYNNNYNDNQNYFAPAQPWRRRNFEDKYAEHFSNYLRKYPQRLQPIYDTREDFVDK